MSRKLVDFVNLHGHDAFSVKDALGTPEEVIDAIQKNCGNSGAVTNHGNMNGLSQLYLYGKEKKYKNIYGQEFYFIPSHKEWRELSEKLKIEKIAQEEEEKKKKIKGNDDDDSNDNSMKEDEEETKSVKKRNPLKYYNHLILLAQSPKGLKNLFRLTYHANRKENFYYFPRIDFDLLQQYNEDLICTSACVGGPFSFESFRKDKDSATVKQRLDDLYFKFNNIFGKDRLFLEIQFNQLDIQHIANREIIDCARRNDAKLVATADYHYPSRELWKEREMMKALAFNKETYTKTEEELKCLLYPKNAIQMYEEAEKYCKTQDYWDEDTIVESINNAHMIDKEMILQYEPDTSLKMSLLVDYKKEPYEKLKELIKEGLKRLFESEYWQKNKFDQKIYIERAKYELSVIQKMNQIDYFLNVYEIVNETSKHMFLGPGRGSSAGSLICYLLGITKLDPIRFGLIFERFVNEGRDTLPDIDTDFEDTDLVDKLIRDKFGDVVYPISTYMTLQLKSAVKDVCKITGIPFQEVNQVTKKMINEAMPKFRKKGDNKSLLEIDWDVVYANSSSLQKFVAKYPHVEKNVKVLMGQVRQVGAHASGIIISKNIWDEMPIQSVKGQLQTSHTEGVANKNLPKMGFVKIDRLGLLTLRMQRKCLELIEAKYGIKQEDMWKSLQPEYINFNDLNVYKTVFHNKRNMTAIFQFTEEGARKFCEKVKPTTIDEIGAITAIYRPGPLASDVDKLYVNTKLNGNIKYEHPILEEILSSTYGFMIFQEQMMFVGNKLGGLSLIETDQLRKLIVKQDKSTQGTADERLNKLYEKYLEGCLSKGLTQEQADKIWKQCEAFSGYAFNKSHALSYAIISFQCAVLRTYYPKEWLCAVLSCNDSSKLIAEVKGQGFVIKTPDVNISNKEWTVDYNNDCFRVGLKSIKGFGDVGIENLLHGRPYISMKDFVMKSRINKKGYEALLKCEAFDSVDKIDFKDSYPRMYAALVETKTRPKDDNAYKTLIEIYCIQPYQEWSIQQKVKNQIEMLGFYDKSVIINQYKKMFKEFDIKPVDKTPDDKNKEKVWGIVENVVEKITGKGKPYLLVTATGESDTQYIFKIWGMSLGKSNKWIGGSIVVFGLDYSEDWGWSLSRSCETIKVA